MMAQVMGILPAMQETHIQFPAPGCDLAQTLLYLAFGGVNQ